MALSPLRDSPALSNPCAVAAMVAIGAAVGAINGVAVAVLKMPSFIATLGTQLAFSGLAILFASKVSPRSSINGLPDQFLVLSGSESSFLVPVLIAAVILGFSHWLLNYTVFGRMVLSVGTNPRASRISGMPVRRVVFALCVLSGLYAGIASVLATSRNEAGIPSLGDKMFISIIASIVIGGTSIAGGSGGFKQTLVGVVLVTLINNAMNLLGIEWYITMLFQGALILVAAFSDRLLRAGRA
jgi:ribose/xylose/arabinose/galactoside ABC-type transport system permease subunit